MNTVENTSIEQLEIEKLKNEVLYLKEQIAWFQRQMFGKRSEKIIRDLGDSAVQYLPGFEDWLMKTEPESKKSEEKLVTAHKRRSPENKGKDSITIPDDLPVERIEIDLPEEEKICSETGLSLVKIGDEVSRKLAHKPGSFFIKEYVRPIYVMPKKAEEGIRIAEMPDSIISKCRADESLLADIITKKFADHLPLYRICEILSRMDIRISRQLLSQWVVRIGLSLRPLYDLMLQNILNTENIFIDESPLDMLAPGKGKAHQAFMWVIAGGKEKDPPNRIYHFKTDRKHCNAVELIGEYSGILHSDKYGAYEKLAADKKIKWCPCWVHIRRKFFEVEQGDLKFRDWCIRKIRYLFMFERVAWNRSPEERLRIRQEKEVPIIDELIKAVKEKLIDSKILPKSKLKQALGYFFSLVPYLKNFTTDPWARIDNNVAERAIRPLTIGRKNWMFVGSEDGGIAAAVFFTLVQTCRALRINPNEYLDDILRRFMSHPHNRLHELLPENWVKLKSQNS